MSTEPVVETVEPVNTEEHGAPEAEAAQEGEQPQDENDDSQKEAKRHKGLERRVGKLTARLKTYEAEIAELRSQREAPSSKADDGPPKLEDFDFDQSKYDLAIARWAARQEIREQQAATEKVKAKQTEIQKQQKAAAIFDDVRDTVDDLDDLIAEAPAIVSPQFAPASEAILDAEPKVAKMIIEHLLRNPQKAEAIAQLSPARQAAEIGKIEALLTPQAQRQSTKAPEPISPVRAKSGAAKSPDDMSVNEWMAWRQKQLRR